MKIHALAALTAAALWSSTALAQEVKPEVEQSAFVGPGLYEIAFSEARDIVYVASVASADQEGTTSSVFGLNPDTLEIVETINVGDAPAFGLGINDATQTLYTTNTRNGSVHAIDLRTGEIVATITNPRAEDRTPHLREVLVDEENNVIYVTDYGGGADGDVWIIDGATNTLSNTIRSVGGSVSGMALDRERGRLYLTSLSTAEIIVVHLESRNVLGTFPVWAARPTNIAFDPVTDRLFVTNQGTGDVAVLRAENGEILAHVPTGSGALGISFDPETNLVYVANRGAGTVSVIDASTLSVVAELETGTRPNTVALDAATNLVYVTNKSTSSRGLVPDDEAGNTVSVIRP